MTDVTPVPAEGSELKTLTDHAVANVVATIAASPAASVEKIVAAEINRIEGQLSLMVADVQNSYEVEKAKIEGEYAKLTAAFSAVKAHIGKLVASHLFAGGVGAVGVAVVKHFL